MNPTLWQERRLRVVYLDYYEVLDWFVMALKGWPQRVVLPLLTGLPADSQVGEVVLDQYRRQFAFLVAHPSFTPVTAGDHVPPLEDSVARIAEVVELPRSVPIERLANQIADRLFTNGAGEQADRLVLFKEVVSGDKKCDLGGWCRHAVVHQVLEVLQSGQPEARS